MKQKKPKGFPARPGPARKRKGVSDISPSTSLPPLVEGQLRCFLKLTISKILWMVAKPPAAFFIRVRWWGETSDGTIFMPRDTSQAEQRTLKTTTRYPVRCGPKQFASYLTDMGTLVLEVMTKSDHLPIGRVQISGLAQLSPTHPINGFFTVVSPTSEKMGELQVSLVLEPLSETFDSSGSIQKTDVSFGVGLSAWGAKQATESSQFLVPSQLHRPPGVSVTGKESIGSSRASTPRGKDHLYFQENSENVKEDLFEPQYHHLAEQNASKQQGLLSGNFHPEAELAGRSPDPVRVFDWHNPAAKDLLSALLDKGSKLRNAMVASTLKSSPEHVLELSEAHPPLKRNVSKPIRKLNFQNLKSDLRSAMEDPLQPPPENLEFDMHAESRAVQLLFDSTDLSPAHLLSGAGSPPESVSLGSDVYDSELNDPHYDQSLLENLFYTTPKFDSSLSDFLSEEEDAIFSGKVNKSHGSKRWRSEKPLESSPLCQKGKDLKTKDGNSPTRPLPDLETSMEPAEETQVVNLSLNRLTVLGRIHLARVVIESIKILPEDNAQSTPGKKSATGKPPRPTLAKKRTFFVEYHFPVGASKNGVGQVAITTEIVRIASSKIIGEAVKFQQRYVFPVHFSGTMITHWWNSDLVFNIYSKKGTQRKPLLIGSAAFQLRDVLLSKQLTVSCDLPVKEEGCPAQLGPLKVSLELAADNKDFSSAAANARTVNVASQASIYSIRSPGEKLHNTDGSTASVKNPQLLKQSNCQFPKSTQEPLSTDLEKSCADVSQQLGPTLSVSHNLLAQITSEEDGLLLHVLLMIPEGKDFISRDTGMHRPFNVYLNCKLFSTEETTRSAVIWGTAQPTFHFSQVTPISLTPKLLERLKNNVMVIEAWNKVHSPGKDRLLGLVKLPLHQFYVSFRDPKISNLLLQAQYPVLAVDGFMPVVDVFSGNNSGSLKVILAMGSAEQVVALQRLKNEEGAAPPILLRPVHSLDPLAMPLPKLLEQEGEGLMEHIFEIHIENVKGLTPLQSTVWGEADCYVQYLFPVQELESSMRRGTESCESGMELKPFRSVTTLCVPDPIFNDERHHSLLVPADVPVQRLLLSAFSAEGLAGGGRIPFEIWCRYYYPNVRDQMVAKGTLPLSRLCAMVTMQHREKVGIQTFSLPLISRTDCLGESHPKSSGLLDVSIKYRRTLKADEGVMAARSVSISVQIHAAAGLQAAARVMAEKNPSLQHSADVGVNTYVSVHLPFFPESERRSTRAVARTFCPEFEYHAEFPCNLIVRRSSGETCSLGELLQFSEIIFSVFHRSLKSAPAATKTQASRDYLLGTVKVPARDLLIRRSGIRGWHPITLPEEVVPSHCANVMQTVVGGLEFSITFAHPGHRERVLDAAKLLDWNWEETHTENIRDDGECQPAPNTVTMTVSIPRLWLPVRCVLLAGQAQINKSVYCYLRYKLYDQKATWTSLRRPKLAGDETQVSMTFKKIKQIDLPWSQTLLWYFREEKLELQVWRAYGNESNVERPLDTDHLIGSAYVDLGVLGQSSRKMRAVSGVFPLFRRNTSNLSGAAVRVHVALAPCSPQCLEPAEDGIDSNSSECEEKSKAPEQDQRDLEHPSHNSDLLAMEIPKEKLPVESPSALDHENIFAVSILVERAMHLSLKGSPLTERGVLAPSSYVSFVTADADNPITTEIVENTDSPVWGFQRQASLSKELLLDPQQHLVFKVWHKAEVERVIGFASVDLSPLLSGFQLVCGWYNVTDFSGQCQGQIKVAISPLESIAHLKKERQSRTPGSSIPATSPFAFQMRDLYAAFPAFSTRGTKDLLNSPLKGTDATKHERTGSLESSMIRHEEHVQNIRRFHESLQQAEGNMHQARSLDLLSHASHSALLRALRKNLSELDEIQMYFSQKLNRSFPDLGAVNRDKDELGASHHRLAFRMVDSEGHHLLEKSNHLVSQVSILINDLQNSVVKNAEDSSGAQGNHGQCSGANVAPCGVLDQKNGVDRTQILRDHPRNEPSSAWVEEEEEEEVPLLPLGEPPCGRGTLYEFLNHASSQNDPPLSVHCNQRGEDAGHVSYSEEEYEEDVIEPRTLNEITTVTDKTSPWSSLVSESEQDLDQEAIIIRNAEQLPGAAEHVMNLGSSRSSPLSSEIQDGPQSLPSTVRSSNSPFGEGESDERVGRKVLDDESEELLQPASVSVANQEGGRPTETQKADHRGAQGMQDRGASGELFPLNDGEFAMSKAAAAEVEERTGGLHGEEGNTNEESPQCCSRLSDTEQYTESCAAGSLESPLEVSDKPLKASVVLSDPVVVPNFFLPVQHLEASMRLLSVSPSLLATSSKTGSGAAAGGIPSRRPNRHKPSLTPAELPEEETKRIARIFSAQFSNKE
ncbi:C2 domain-containing protein 3 [Tiliqua scincoides]|uniref:C2 domain-containing protein 3 n=1 Tax=Tiliqua scincoides TaxID=71010 RepID=UPI003463281A